MLADAARRGSIRMSADPASSRARTETLYALEAVAERNRPVAPPKKPEAAPFFLPSEMDAQRRDAAPPPALPPPPPEDDAFAGDDGSDADGSDADGAVTDAAAEASRCRLASLSLAEDATAVATWVEIKILRCVRPPRHRRDVCSMAWRCRFLAARRSQHGRVITENMT